MFAIRKTEQTSSSEQKAKELLAKVIEHSDQKMKDAVASSDLSLWIKAKRYNDYKTTDFSWIFDLEGCGNYSFDDFLKDDFDSAENTKYFNKMAAKASEMLEQQKDQDPLNEIIVSLRRVRVDERSWKYISIAKFPNDSREAGSWIYTPNGVSCAEHHCDVLYKASAEAGHMFRLEYKNMAQLFKESRLLADQLSQVEFKSVASEIGELAAAQREITRALMGYYSNLKKIKLPESFAKS